MADAAAGIGFEVVAVGSARHAEALRLRYEALRRPLAMAPGTEVYRAEAECLHMVALEGGRVVGCVLFHPQAPEVGRLLQMAVAAERRGLGFGRALVRHLEAHLRGLGVRRVTLHARHYAVGFYERLGYEIEGEPFEEVGMAHRHMMRRLGPVQK